MPQFSDLSKKRLAECHPDLQRILNVAIKEVDFTVMCGHRGKAEQDEAFENKKSRVRWPNSKHNKVPSTAVDIAPWLPEVKIDWNDTAAFARLVGYIERIADDLGVRIRWGGDWNENFRTRDERLIDMPHIELVDPRDV
jgi:peptidoglycan LD-endopeptidase CwlK